MEDSATCPRCGNLASYEVDRDIERITCYKCGYLYEGDLDNIVDPIEVFGEGVVHILHTDGRGQVYVCPTPMKKDQIIKLVTEGKFNVPIKEAYFTYFNKGMHKLSLV